VAAVAKPRVRQKRSAVRKRTAGLYVELAAPPRVMLLKLSMSLRLAMHVEPRDVSFHPKLPKNERGATASLATRHSRIQRSAGAPQAHSCGAPTSEIPLGGSLVYLSGPAQVRQLAMINGENSYDRHRLLTPEPLARMDRLARGPSSRGLDRPA